MKNRKSKPLPQNHAIGNLMLESASPIHLEIVRTKFPVSVDIQETECNSMTNGNHDRMLLKKEYYNEYCLVEIQKGTEQFHLTIFKSDWKDFERIESDFMYGFSFVPKDSTETFVIINALV